MITTTTFLKPKWLAIVIKNLLRLLNVQRSKILHIIGLISIIIDGLSLVLPWGDVKCS